MHPLISSSYMPGRGEGVAAAGVAACGSKQQPGWQSLRQQLLFCSGGRLTHAQVSLRFASKVLDHVARHVQVLAGASRVSTEQQTKPHHPAPPSPPPSHSSRG